MILVATVTATIESYNFASDRPRTSLPILSFVALFLMTGLAFLLILPLIRRSQLEASNAVRRLLVLIVAVGLVLRLVLLASEPILEVDYNRYLWDGALAGRGYNPYAIAPADIRTLPYNDPRLELSKAAGELYEHISYPELRTIYPPVAQAAFALANWISPWSLNAWRLIAIAGDVATLALLLALLREIGRSPLWSALYWWCPLVLKEVVNTAHVEAILTPLVLATLWLAARGQHLAAVAMLGLAIGTKLWPVMLAPLLLRPLLNHPARLAAGLAILALGLAATALPILLGGLDRQSGFVSFADHWTTNSALFPLLERGLRVLPGVDPQSLMPGRLLRLVAAGLVLGLAVLFARAPILDARDLIRRAFIVVSFLLLLSPAQFPWYVLWVLPLAVLVDGRGWHVAAALMPLYYAAFHFIVTGATTGYAPGLAWLIWLPVWVVLVIDARQYRYHQQPSQIADGGLGRARA